MSRLKKEMLRKIEARKIALLASADSKAGSKKVIGEYSPFELSFGYLLEGIRYASDISQLSIYKYLQGNRIKIFIKKCIRKALMITCGWMINPLLEQQTAFNKKIINALCDIKDLLLEKEMQYQQIEKEKHTPAISGEDIDQLRNTVNYISNMLNITYEPAQVNGVELDYFDFENRFRGSRESVKQIQREYVKYFKTTYMEGYVLDIGSGRGEFLELMLENDIKAKGIDCYLPFVNYCLSKGYNVECIDALKYLESLEDESLNGIFMGQVVEHLNPDYFRKMLQTAYKKLKTGAYFLVETPNPESLTTYLGFYSDPSHIKPVPYQELEYFFKYFKFREVRCHHNSVTEYEHKIPHIQSESISNLEEINFAIDVVNLVLFGARDYTLIAVK